MTRNAVKVSMTPWTRRSGYTLLELLIASVLVATLMAAAWNLMSMYSTFLTAGRAQAVEQQLARSLMDLIATDLRSVLSTVDTGPASAFDSSSTSLLSEAERGPGLPASATGIAQFVPDNAAFFRPGGEGSLEGAVELPQHSFLGDASSLTLITLRSAPDLRAFELEDDLEANALSEPITGRIDSSGGGLSDLRLDAEPAVREWSQVMFRFEPMRSVRADDRELLPGLHRFEIPIEHLGLLDNLSSTTDTMSAGAAFEEDEETDVAEQLLRLAELGVPGVAHEHIPEVVACRFEFFDQSGWRTEWDRFAQGIPQVVRLRVKLLSTSEYEELSALLNPEALLDQSESGEVDATAAIEAVGSEANPMAAFRPREYERTILLAPVRALRSQGEADLPYEMQPSIGNPFLAGDEL